MTEDTEPGNLRVEIDIHRDGEMQRAAFGYRRRTPDERPMALDVLLQAQATTMPELAFRFGCRARNCGRCTIDINGKTRIACRAPGPDADNLSPMPTLPVRGRSGCAARWCCSAVARPTASRRAGQ